MLVITARGEMFNENLLVEFLAAHPRAMLAADVVAGEVAGKRSSPLIAYARTASRVRCRAKRAMSGTRLGRASRSLRRFMRWPRATATP